MAAVANDLLNGTQIEGSPSALPLIPWEERGRINSYITQSTVSGGLTLQQQLFLFASLPHGIPAIVSPLTRENERHMRLPFSHAAGNPGLHLKLDYYAFNIQCQYWMFARGSTVMGPDETARLVCLTLHGATLACHSVYNAPIGEFPF